MPEEKYNSDELVPPSFLTEQFILDRLREVENDPDLHLIDYSIKPGSAAGDHYASVMFKFTVTYGTARKVVKGRRFLLKTLPEADGQKKEFLKGMPMFPNEIVMYKHVLPTMEKVLAEFGEKGWWPKCVYTSEDPQVLIFDDLTQQNYQMFYDPLNVERIQILVDAIAKYHALSLIIGDKGLLDVGALPLKTSFDIEAVQFMMNSMTRYVKPLAAEARTWPGYEKIADKLVALEPRLVHYFLDLFHTTNTWGYNVLNHGDFHIRNMMFKKNQDGSLAEVAFLDFQVPIYHSPAYDVYSLLNNMGSHEVRERKEEVVKSYHTKFAEYLRKYGFSGQIPTLIQLHVELLRLSRYDAFQTLCFLPVFQIDLTGVELSELFTEGEENPMTVAVKTLFKEPVFAEHMRKLLYSLDNRGVLD